MRLDESTVTVEWLERQLTLAQKEEKDTIDETSGLPSSTSRVNIFCSKEELLRKCKDVELANEYVTIMMNNDNANTSIIPHLSDLIQRCCKLIKLTSTFPTTTTTKSSKVEKEILKKQMILKQHVISRLRTELRTVLHQCHYPTKDGCMKLASSHPNIQSTLIRPFVELQCTSILGNELCRPLIQRVHHHFFLQSPSSQPTTIPPLSLIQEYIQEFIPPMLQCWNILFQSQPQHVAIEIRTNFQKQMIFMILPIALQQLVLLPNNKKMEQILQDILLLDDYLLTTMMMENTTKTIITTTTTTSINTGVLDIVLFKYPSVLKWWMTLECHSMQQQITTTSYDTDDDVDMNNDKIMLSSTVEYFITFWNSIQEKAKYLSPKPKHVFVTRVSLSLCETLLTTFHQQAYTLKQSLQKKTSNIQSSTVWKWLNLITSCHVTSFHILLHKSDDDDIKPMGTSLETLRDAMIEECCHLLFETVVMKHAKFASYLIQCAHMLSSSDENDNFHMMDYYLQESCQSLQMISMTCTQFIQMKSSSHHNNWIKNVVGFAPNKLLTNFHQWMEEKLLEVILDDTYTITNLNGVQQFDRHVQTIVSTICTTENGLNYVLELSKFMSSSKDVLQPLHDTFINLFSATTSQHHAPTTRIVLDHVDEKLHHQAETMLRAKGYTCMKLNDAICILNKRML